MRNRGPVRRNPVWEVIQRNTVAPGHVVFEWIDVDEGQWVDARDLPARRPPRKPGKHLTAPGAQLMFMHMKDGSIELSFSRSFFVKDKHHWGYAFTNGSDIQARIDHGRMQLLTPADRGDLVVMEMLLAYAMYETKEHAAQQRVSSRREAHARRNPREVLICTPCGPRMATDLTRRRRR